ncbi:Flp pilus assembly protein CpaB [Pseudohalocynthiibacter aestuariivivens]|jgi:pilus assembly protein CpaB|uniref:Flp pilus assembly protein CpaB n=1 Tax=Pseudohalocynthiibacter aestuariivivens TaxID=1591409 RepID=A0ABV5JBQ5_9RHOB|nr:MULTISPECIES: Flp pilus assembly protein CpaB [Pseudohalocynthiibacter]MBS9718829.1 Flp pilus assembly protein CpaB [Pseudohalocynthiibacter aestuariivivens]MCK0104176.1 Flp pilus assembly protein CpaB [Pseudohalocynthiibacter sp. F2068]
MRLIFGLVLILGIGLAGFAVYMAKGYMGTYQAELARERAARAAIVPTVDVYVVTREIKYGERVTVEDLRAVKWPETAIPEGTFHTMEEIFPEGEAKYRTAVRTIEKDEAVMQSKLTETGQIAGITSRLQPGMRAFTIDVDASTGVSGFLRPGHRVDVYWSGQSQNQEVTKLIDSGIDVIAIDQSANEERESARVARTVTVQITPQQVASLAQAQATGRLSLSLVGNNDDTLATAIEVDQNRLLGIVEQQRVEVEQERVCTIRTRRGAEVVEIPITCTN